MCRWRSVAVGVGMCGGWRRQVVAACVSTVLPCRWWWWFALQVLRGVAVVASARSGGGEEQDDEEGGEETFRLSPRKVWLATDLPSGLGSRRRRSWRQVQQRRFIDYMLMFMLVRTCGVSAVSARMCVRTLRGLLHGGGRLAERSDTETATVAATATTPTTTLMTVGYWWVGGVVYLCFFSLT